MKFLIVYERVCVLILGCLDKFLLLSRIVPDNAQSEPGNTEKKKNTKAWLHYLTRKIANGGACGVSINI